MKKTDIIDLNNIISASKPSAHIKENLPEKIVSSLEISPHMPSLGEVEKTMLYYIALGNVTLSEDFLEYASKHNLFHVYVGSLASQPLKHAQFALAATITLFCRTAIDNGLPETIAYNIRDMYIRCLSNLTEEQEIYPLYIRAFRKYSQAMQNWKFSECSPQIKLCCEYIFSHLQTKITMNDLSKICHYSPNYISDLFQKELGIRTNAYIRREKLNYAAYLLKRTFMSISEIAELLAFPSDSAFVMQFRALYGITPYQYRKSDSDSLINKKTKVLAELTECRQMNFYPT